MNFAFLFLLGILAYAKALPLSPVPNYGLCGSDGKTYKNLCEWKLAQLLNPSLELQYLGPCKENPYGNLYQALLQNNDANDMLRSKKRKRKGYNKRLSSSDDPDDLFQRIGDMRFNFRRDYEEDEEE